MDTRTVSEDLDAAIDSLKAVVMRQRRDDDPAHEDLYSWACGLSELPAVLSSVARLLTTQVAHYGDRRILRDDDGWDPAERLDEATGHLAAFVNAVEQANAAARALSFVGRTHRGRGRRMGGGVNEIERLVFDY